MSKNIYEAPNSKLHEDPSDEPSEKIVDADLGERWGRGKYFTYTLGALLLFVSPVAIVFADYPYTSVIVMVLNSCIYCYTSMFRLRDIGVKPYISIMFLLPGLNIILFLIYCFVPGDEGPNQYGRRS